MYTKKQRIMAWVGIVLLLLLYAISFLLGISGKKEAFPMFIASLLATFFIPAMIYIFQIFIKHEKEKHSE